MWLPSSWLGGQEIFSLKIPVASSLSLLAQRQGRSGSGRTSAAICAVYRDRVTANDMIAFSVDGFTGLQSPDQITAALAMPPPTPLAREFASSVTAPNL